MPRTRKFAWKPKFSGNTYMVVNKTTGVSERSPLQSDKSGNTSSENITSVPPTTNDNSVNMKIYVVGKNFCKSKSDFTQDCV
jgi:hypothetical protein